MKKLDAGKAPITAFERFHFATLDWHWPIGIAIVYAAIVIVWSRYNNARLQGDKSQASRHSSSRSTRPAGVFRKNQPKLPPKHVESRFTPFNCLVMLHNAFLSVFSLAVFVSIVPILIKSYSTRTLFDSFCDIDQIDYYAGINYLSWIFYLSKYYELLDTVILLLKGKPSSFLQTFHHSGSIISLWSMVTTRIPGMWIFATLNSFIHTLMYVYYLLTCLGYRPTWKKTLTAMQIIQFFIGNGLGITYFILPGCFREDRVRENVIAEWVGGHYRSIICTFVYNFAFVGSLIFLFTDFSRKTYGNGNGNGKSYIKEQVPVAHTTVDEPKNKRPKKARTIEKSPVRKAKIESKTDKKPLAIRRSPRKAKLQE